MESQRSSVDNKHKLEHGTRLSAYLRQAEQVKYCKIWYLSSALCCLKECQLYIGWLLLGLKSMIVFGSICLIYLIFFQPYSDKIFTYTMAANRLTSLVEKIRVLKVNHQPIASYTSKVSHVWQPTWQVSNWREASDLQETLCKTAESCTLTEKALPGRLL